METVLNFLGSPVGAVYVVIGILLLIPVLRNYFPGLKQYEPMIFKAFNAIEKMIKDTPAGEENALSKLDLYLKEFSKQYAAKYGKEPSVKTLNHAKDKVESLVFHRNNG